MTETVTTHSPAETERLGERLGAALRPGDCLALFGDLGAGKTALCRGIARGAGFSGAVTSPTFALVNEYRGGRVPIAHFDMYRITTEDDLLSTGLYDYLDSGFAVLIEWAENVEDFLDADYRTVQLAGAGDEPRTIILSDGRGPQ